MQKPRTAPRKKTARNGFMSARQLLVEFIASGVFGRENKLVRDCSEVVNDDSPADRESLAITNSVFRVTESHVLNRTYVRNVCLNRAYFRKSCFRTFGHSMLGSSFFRVHDPHNIECRDFQLLNFEPTTLISILLDFVGQTTSSSLS